MGKISSPISRSLRFIIVLSAVQLGCTAALIGWWGHLLLDLYSQVSHMQIEQVPSAVNKIQSELSSKRIMVLLEGAWFTAVIFLGTIFLAVLYYRDFRRSRALQAFFASLTHELKTPLTSIRLQAESIGDLEISDPYAIKLVQRLLGDTSRLENQVERTLELARIEGGGPVLASSFWIGPTLERVISTWPMIESKKIDISNRVQNALIKGDQAAVQIIFKNLLENSVRHGGKDDLKVEIESEVSQDKILLRYKDNGRGVPLHQIRRLGRLFQKGPESHGAGVGLYLVDLLMKRMGGQVIFSGHDGFQACLVFLKGTQDGA